jgi:folate-dependent phosphoribosylglycinamide formyltransferase PurN
MYKPRLLVFASGSKDGGGSGFEKLVLASRDGILQADIVAVVSNHAAGGVAERAQKLSIPFVHFTGPWEPDPYFDIFHRLQADFVALSGWLKLVQGLDPRITINVHPGPLPEFGGSRMYGHHVHEAVMSAYRRGELMHSCVTMHFATEKYDEGPVFFRQYVGIEPGDTPETLGTRVNAEEHKWQAWATNLVVTRQIAWDGRHPSTLRLPSGYDKIRQKLAVKDAVLP